MGNSSNTAFVKLRLTYCRLHSLPQNPWSKRIDKRTWNEFTNICEDAVELSSGDIFRNKNAYYNKYQYYKYLCLLMVIILCTITYKIIQHLWIKSIIFIAAIIFIVPIIKYSPSKQQFINTIKYRLRNELSTLNKKYNKQIKFTVTHQHNIVTMTCITIKIELFVEYVQYVSNQNIAHKLGTCVIGLMSGGIIGGMTGVAIVGGSIFVGGCMSAVSAPIVAGAGIITVASQVLTGGTAAITVYATGATATYVGGCSALCSAIGGLLTGYKCNSVLDAFKFGAFAGYEWGKEFANIWLDEAK